MPLAVIDSAFDTNSLFATVQDGFLIYYSSVVDGVLWCPDCRDVEDLVKQTFSADDGPKGVIVYVGDRPEWKTNSNKFRSEPFNIQSVPTIVKIKNAKEVGRLVDEHISPQLSAFVKD
ncbi:hypothetical protein HGRIS_008316 [Hohenbuehelia grisea]|uniref:Thioredoxin domain-containing protein n=1 Tax=Hohenbuehelia grisea TaxID=104357 RepID=A0ABR3J7Z5_9AGAR